MDAVKQRRDAVGTLVLFSGSALVLFLLGFSGAELLFGATGVTGMLRGGK